LAASDEAIFLNRRKYPETIGMQPRQMINNGVDHVDVAQPDLSLFVQGKPQRDALAIVPPLFFLTQILRKEIWSCWPKDSFSTWKPSPRPGVTPMAVRA
jgi:hypothetical protein